MKAPASTSRPSLGSLLLKKQRRPFLGIDKQRAIRLFFASNSSVAIIVLVLIMLFLLREGMDFLPTYRHELETYRRAGLEFCDIINRPLAEHQALCSKLRRAASASLNTLTHTARTRRDAAFELMREVEEETRLQRAILSDALAQIPAASPEKLTRLRQEMRAATTLAAARLQTPAALTPEEGRRLQRELTLLNPEVPELPPLLAALSADYIRVDREAHATFKPLVDAVEAFEAAPDALHTLLDAMKKHARETKAQVTELHGSGKEPSHSKPVDFDLSIVPLTSGITELTAKVEEYTLLAQKTADTMPAAAGTPQAVALLAEMRARLPDHLAAMRQAAASLPAWSHSKPVSYLEVVIAFFLGDAWITNSSWQDFFGFVPLLTGSVLIALIAVLIATPFSVIAAIYTNQFASEREQEFIKPVIEFIQAIPSVVLGFIGISLLGDAIKGVSEWGWLQWIPSFPIQERLNMFNAACLLALMAVPTMYSLAEDALNNVPRSYLDASDALGATKLQTVFRVIVPAAKSGIAAAVLLGMGRVIGETMVVLLVAGNRIAIPDFSAGPGVVFQPAHTLTGIIAQELGEVSRGSAHWQALFMVGIVLFLISLLVNWCARAFVRRFELAKS
jgi:phosphate transport system permease protein